MCSAVLDLYPDAVLAMAVFSSRKRLSPYNMFCMKYKGFVDYCTWLFFLLELIESRLKAVAYPYQRRSIGFMAERLLGLYCEYRDLKVKYRPVFVI